MIKLNDYGWNKTHETNWAEMYNHSKMKKCVPGRVTLEHKRMYRVITSRRGMALRLFRCYAT